MKTIKMMAKVNRIASGSVQSATTALALSCLLYAVGCSKPEPPPPPPPEVVAAPPVQMETTSISFDVLENPTAESIIPEGKVLSGSEVKTLQEDFNLDGNNDLAVLRRNEMGVTEVSVYLHSTTDPVDEGSDQPASRQFVKAGAIGSDDGDVTGLMSRKRSEGGREYTDLIILFTRSDGSTDMVQYVNDGTGFERVDY